VAIRRFTVIGGAESASFAFNFMPHWPRLARLRIINGLDALYDYTGAKAVLELGWQPRDLRQAWLATLSEERRRAGEQ
jgi:hypothetical protein